VTGLLLQEDPRLLLQDDPGLRHGRRDEPDAGQGRRTIAGGVHPPPVHHIHRVPAQGWHWIQGGTVSNGGVGGMQRDSVIRFFNVYIKSQKDPQICVAFLFVNIFCTRRFSNSPVHSPKIYHIRITPDLFLFANLDPVYSIV
jgi:hypothetical protein